MISVSRSPARICDTNRRSPRLPGRDRINEPRAGAIDTMRLPSNNDLLYLFDRHGVARRGDFCDTIGCAFSSTPPFSMYVVVPVVRNMWQHTSTFRPAAIEASSERRQSGRARASSARRCVRASSGRGALPHSLRARRPSQPCRSFVATGTEWRRPLCVIIEQSRRSASRPLAAIGRDAGKPIP